MLTMALIPDHAAKGNFDKNDGASDKINNLHIHIEIMA